MPSSNADFKMTAIAYLLIQFVDIHGAPKVKLVPASTLRSVAEVGAGFAGGAVWGMGQGPHSHDLQARADLGELYPLALRARASRGSRRTSTSTASLILIVRASISSACSRGPGQQGYLFNVGIEPEFFLVVKRPGRLDPRLGPSRRRRSRQAVLRLSRASPVLSVSCASSTTASTGSAGASISPTMKTPISSTKSTFDMPTPSRPPIA